MMRFVALDKILVTRFEHKAFFKSPAIVQIVRTLFVNELFLSLQNAYFRSE